MGHGVTECRELYGGSEPHEGGVLREDREVGTEPAVRITRQEHREVEYIGSRLRCVTFQHRHMACRNRLSGAPWFPCCIGRELSTVTADSLRNTGQEPSHVR
jgi:hypothetical protein